MKDEAFEEVLVAGIKRKDSKIFEELVTKYQLNIFRTAIGLLHNKEDAEEITQDVFLKAFLSIDSFKGESKLSTWLYRIAINTSLNHLRQKKRKQFWQSLSAAFDLSSGDKNAEAHLTDNSNRELIRSAIDKIPEKQRIAFILHKYEDLSQREVAEIMKLSEGAIEQLVIRAKNNLQKILEKKLEKA